MSSAPSPDLFEEPAPDVRAQVWLISMFVVAALVTGIIAAVAWRLIVRLPSYVVQDDGSASVTERASTEFFAADAWYVALGVVCGAALGFAAWRKFKHLGWPTAFLAGGLGLVAGVVCWQFGQLLSGAPFDERLAAARPGDSVPIGLALRSPSALAVWAFAAVTPILLGSALGPDEEAAPREPKQIPTDEPVSQQTEVVDELGVARPDERVP